MAYGIARDAHGHVYVTGYTVGGLDGNPNAGQSPASDIFIVKYTTAGIKR